MVSQEVVNKARISMKISGRYDHQDGTFSKIGRRDWTPAQKRRMRKKFRKNDIIIPSFAESGK